MVRWHRAGFRLLALEVPLALGTGASDPTLFSGGQGLHSVKECISLQWIAEAVGVCLHLIEVWVEHSRAT